MLAYIRMLPYKHQKTEGFVLCSGGTNLEHWLEMD